MNKITTNDCKNFLAAHFLTDPAMLIKLWDDEPGVENVVSSAAVPSNWVRESKGRKPSRNDWYASDNGYSTNRKDVFIRIEDIKAIRLFVLMPAYYDSMIRFIVIEDKGGQLHLGPECGE